MYHLRGRFIVLDGGEGAGKTSLLQWLKETLPSDKYVFTREPGGTKVAESVRALLLDGSAMEVLTEFLLFWSARAEHIGKIIRPAIESGKTVISDRFDSSTFAYQIYGRDQHVLLPYFEDMRRICCQDIVPDSYIFLDVDPEIGIARAMKRNDSNHFDEQELSFHTRVREGYNSFFKKYPCVRVNAGTTFEKVTEEVLQIITSTEEVVIKT